MMGVGAFSSRLTRACAWLLGVAACAVLAPALSATPALAAEPCPNEQLREESNTNPVTGRRYSAELPECRAYEMVSPLYKQSHSAFAGPLVAPDGETVTFHSEGAFSEPENYRVEIFPRNVYLSRRTPSGWITASAFAPRNLVDANFLFASSDFSPDLRSAQVSCGTGSPVLGEQKGVVIVCAERKSGGSWVPSAPHTALKNTIVEGFGYAGASSDLSRVFLMPSDEVNLLPADTFGGIYELTGFAGEAEELRLVNVDNAGSELGNAREATQPLLGSFRPAPKSRGSSYHAISASGGTVFFTATPTAEQIEKNHWPLQGEQATVYARVGAEKTVAVSNPSPSECTACSLAKKPAKPAIFQGASADGSKVFFTTAQQLLTKDTDSTNDLYEFDFKPPAGEPQLVQVSGGGPGDPTPGAGAKVRGVLRNSGSHVYFVAEGVLTNEEKEGKKAEAGKPNLYGYDTHTGQTKFVATLSLNDQELWGGSKVEGSQASVDEGTREVQTTPDGRYLVFSSFAQLAGDTNSGAAYRYDFETGELTWISHAAPGFPALNKGKPATIAPLGAATNGANAAIGDWERAISENGEYVVFTTPEPLQAGAVEGVINAYLWHEDRVSLISPGGSAGAAISSSGSDIFFNSASRLVGQDTDSLGDIYDARVGGGFPAPPAEPSCSGDACQGSPSPPPSFGPSTSSLLPAGGNLAPPPPPAPVKETEKKLTPAQELAKALAACKREPKTKRAACESQARRRYAAQQLAEALAACKRKPKTKRAACESQARKRYRR